MDWLKRLRERIFRNRISAESQVSGEPSEMEWLEKLTEPFFRSRQDAESYVTSELAAVVPEGWVVVRYSDQPLTWTIEKQRFTQDYSVRISKGLDVVILSYGNSSAGMFGLHHALHYALVIDSVMLRKFSLRECLGFMFANHKPNEWSCT
jgi:hypothetical protein